MRRIQSALLSLDNAYNAIGDTPSSYSSWYFERFCNGKILTPQEQFMNFQNVTKARIVQAASTLKLDSIYYMLNKEAGIMEKNIITSQGTGDKIIHVKHDSGLDIYICEMEGYSSVEALFGTKYGSVNTMFKMAQDKEYTVVPEGIAHFLEHKLFENEDCDVFELYAKTGASGNAFTSFDKTCYLFSCSKNYQESLKILLDFVQKPYFTQETVDKEQGIIGQEIQMTNDNPEWRVFFNMLRCMYHNHPVKIDIAGTVESIAQINAELLYKCYYTFYNLNNMVLSIAGNVKADEVLAICDECLKKCEDKGLETVFPDEPESIVQHEINEEQPVGTSIFNIGYKCRPCKGMERLKKSMPQDL